MSWIVSLFCHLAEERRQKISEGDWTRGFYAGSATAYEHCARVIEREAAKGDARPGMFACQNCHDHFDVGERSPEGLCPTCFLASKDDGERPPVREADAFSAALDQSARTHDALGRPREVIDGLRVEEVIQHVDADEVWDRR